MSGFRHSKFGLTLLILALAFSTGATAAVRHISVPMNGISPDVAVGSSGKLFLVFGQDGNAYFAVSHDEGRTFSKPVRLNSTPGSVLAGHERGPKIAVGPRDTLHVVWLDPKNAELEYTRGLDGGETFSPPRNLRDPGAHLDEATVAADSAGNVFITWLDSRLPQDKQNPLSLPVLAVYSRDGGKTFSPNQAIESAPPIRACSCCALKATALGPGKFALAFRGAYHNIRDAFVARVHPDGRRLQATLEKTQDQEWHFEGCPMAGPSLAVGAKPNILWVSWMSNGRAYWARSDDAGEHFGPSESPGSLKENIENHPLVLVNRAGDVLIAWEQGGDVLWQILGADGKRKNSGDAGPLTPDSKAAGVVDSQGNFCLVY